jgi:hypothetical protein
MSLLSISCCGGGIGSLSNETLYWWDGCRTGGEVCRGAGLSYGGHFPVFIVGHIGMEVPQAGGVTNAAYPQVRQGGDVQAYGDALYGLGGLYNGAISVAGVFDSVGV